MKSSEAIVDVFLVFARFDSVLPITFLMHRIEIAMRKNV